MRTPDSCWRRSSMNTPARCVSAPAAPTFADWSTLPSAPPCTIISVSPVPTAPAAASAQMVERQSVMTHILTTGSEVHNGGDRRYANVVDDEQHVPGWRGKSAVGGRSDGEAARTGRESQRQIPLAHVDSVRHVTRRNQSHLRDVRRVGRLNDELLVVSQQRRC